MLDKPASKTQSGSKAPARPAARPAAASGRSGSRRSARPHRPADQQGHRAHSAGALAVHRRHAGGSAPRLPVHQRHRLQGPQIRHAGGGRRAGVVAGDLRARHGPPGRGDRRGLDGGDRPSDPAGRHQRRAVPGGRHHRRCAEDRRAEGPAGAGVDAGLRRRALSHRDALRHPGSRERRPQHGHLSRRAESGRPRGVPHGGARGDRRGRLSCIG